jgi:type IV secretory pathway VirB2 component (pilin)
MAATASLFDTPSAPVLASATDWASGTLFGGLAAGLCVLAVAFVGVLLMTGRLAIRDGIRTVVGCFVLLGAPVLAGGLLEAAGAAVPAAGPGVPVIEAAAPPAPLPPADYDPYAGASLRQN